jgi:hypothetical protein
MQILRALGPQKSNKYRSINYLLTTTGATPGSPPGEAARHDGEDDTAAVVFFFSILILLGACVFFFCARISLLNLFALCINDLFCFYMCFFDEKFSS